jgi:hypothetical protein
MANDLWGASPLYENEGLKVSSIPTVTPIDQVQVEGHCGEVTNRGEEACECAGQLTESRRQSHSRQNCDATDRNQIQGRCGQASEPTITKPSSFIRPGQLGACAAKVIRLIQGDPPDVPATQACLNAELPPVNLGGVGRKSAEVVALFRRRGGTQRGLRFSRRRSNWSRLIKWLSRGVFLRTKGPDNHPARALRPWAPAQHHAPLEA